MYDTVPDVSDILCDTLPLEDGDLPFDVPRPTTPLPDRSRTLRRTISCASLDTLCPPTKKGVRRRIKEIAENLKHKSTNKKKKRSGTRDVPKNESGDVTSDSKALSERKTARRGREAVSPLRDSVHISEEENILVVADSLHSGVPLELDSSPTFPCYMSNSLDHVSLLKEGEEIWENCSLPVRSLALGAHVTEEDQDSIAKIEDVQLEIRASEREVTIWDGLQTAHHVHKCRLFLRCTTHPYDDVLFPDVRRVEMECTTRPARSVYSRPPVFQAAYEGAVPGLTINSVGLPDVTLAAGIHMDLVWCKILNDDGTWGWYRDAFVPLSPRLFDKVDYREFKLVSRVWVKERCVETESTFGISMLLRGLDMSN